MVIITWGIGVSKLVELLYLTVSTHMLCIWEQKSGISSVRFRQLIHELFELITICRWRPIVVCITSINAWCNMAFISRFVIVISIVIHSIVVNAHRSNRFSLLRSLRSNRETWLERQLSTINIPVTLRFFCRCHQRFITYVHWASGLKNWLLLQGGELLEMIFLFTSFSFLLKFLAIYHHS